MREIKFRFTFKAGRDTQSLDMTLDELLDSSFTEEKMAEQLGLWGSNYELFKRQYTEKKDENGIEIYEGCILEYPDEAGSKGEVIFDDGRWYAIGAECFIRYQSFSKCKVIGSIYENSELLKEQKR